MIPSAIKREEKKLEHDEFCEGKKTESTSKVNFQKLEKSLGGNKRRKRNMENKNATCICKIFFPSPIIVIAVVKTFFKKKNFLLSV